MAHPAGVLAAANASEAERCVAIAEECIRKLQFEKARRFCQKAIRLSPGSAVVAVRLLRDVEDAIESGRAPRISETHQTQAAPTQAAPPTPTPPVAQAATPVMNPFVWFVRRCDSCLRGMGIVDEYRTQIVAVYCMILIVASYKFVFAPLFFPQAPRRVWPTPPPPVAASGWSFFTILPGDISYVSPGFSFYAPLVSVFVVTKVFEVIGRLRPV